MGFVIHLVFVYSNVSNLQSQIDPLIIPSAMYVNSIPFHGYILLGQADFLKRFKVLIFLLIRQGHHCDVNISSR